MLRFETIDLDLHRELCIGYRRDSYACSFEDGLVRFDAENGADGTGYIEWLSQRIQELPQGCVHAWRGDSIVGQIESRLRDDNSGYVNLFYLVPDARGEGLGRELNTYAVNMFSALNVDVIRLTVSKENESAIGFYRKLGWKDLGLRPGRDDGLLFEFTAEETNES